MDWSTGLRKAASVVDLVGLKGFKLKVGSQAASLKATASMEPSFRSELKSEIGDSLYEEQLSEIELAAAWVM